MAKLRSEQPVTKRSGVHSGDERPLSLNLRLRPRQRATPSGEKLSNGSGNTPGGRRFDLIKASSERRQPLITLPDVFRQAVQRLPCKNKLAIAFRDNRVGLAQG